MTRQERISQSLCGCVQSTLLLSQKSFLFGSNHIPVSHSSLSSALGILGMSFYTYLFFQTVLCPIQLLFFLILSILVPSLFPFPFYFGPQTTPFPSMSTAVGSNLINSSLIAYPTHAHTHPPSIPLAIQQPSLKKGKYFHTN